MMTFLFLFLTFNCAGRPIDDDRDGTGVGGLCGVRKVSIHGWKLAFESFTRNEFWFEKTKLIIIIDNQIL